MPFRQQIINHQGDIFSIQTSEQKQYEGAACVEDQNVYVLDSNQQTVVVPLSQVSSIRNVTLSKSEQFRLTEEGDISFCVQLTNTVIDTNFENSELSVELRLQNTLNLECNCELIYAQRAYHAEDNIVTDAGFLSRFNELGTKTMTHEKVNGVQLDLINPSNREGLL